MHHERPLCEVATWERYEPGCTFCGKAPFMLDLSLTQMSYDVARQHAMHSGTHPLSLMQTFNKFLEQGNQPLAGALQPEIITLLCEDPRFAHWKVARELRR